jgi:uncharacterized protein
MWHQLALFVYRSRFILLACLLALTAWLGWQAKNVKLSYEFSNAIPTDNPKYKAYKDFRKKFGEDGNVLVAGIQTDKLFTPAVFNAYTRLHRQFKAIKGVEDVLSIPAAANLVLNDETTRLQSVRVFPDSVSSQQELDSCRGVFESLLFYKYILYNPETKSYLAGVRINGDSLNSKNRESVVGQVVAAIDVFEKNTGIEVHRSGLPLIRSVMATRIQNEMKFFLLGSVLLAAIILFLFFRSFSAMMLSLTVVAVGVVWSLATIHLLGYKITLLTALIPPLIVVIGIPNCIYFLNKYHSAWLEKHDKKEALVTMIGKMGVVTLFCNITAAIGFAVFAITRSQILREFGMVAGINILALFFISLIIIPAALSVLKAPNKRQLRYLESRVITGSLERMERWVVNHPKFTFTGTALLVLISGIGLLKLKSGGFIVDDIPHNDKIYTDLKFFEKNFKGVMPLEIVINTQKKKGIRLMFNQLDKIDSLELALQQYPYMNKPVSFVDGLKFAKQAMSGGDSSSYFVPNMADMSILAPYLRAKKDTAGGDSAGNKVNTLSKISSSFIDSAEQEFRISMSMADVGSLALPKLLDSVTHTVLQYIDTSKFKVQLTGSSVTFLEGSHYIIKGLKESILWAFLFITISMFLLFRSVRILICSLIPNIVPLIITAGVMGWMGVPLKPSTVLVFSVTLGIAIDITIRFLVNYRQELPNHGGDVMETVRQTIRQTGLSIIYTSLVLLAGFVIFMFSGFGGTRALGGLTTLTLFVATITNLVLLPVLLLLGKRKASNVKGETANCE